VHPLQIYYLKIPLKVIYRYLIWLLNTTFLLTIPNTVLHFYGEHLTVYLLIFKILSSGDSNLLVRFDRIPCTFSKAQRSVGLLSAGISWLQRFILGYHCNRCSLAIYSHWGGRNVNVCLFTHGIRAITLFTTWCTGITSVGSRRLGTPIWSDQRWRLHRKRRLSVVCTIASAVGWIYACAASWKCMWLSVDNVIGVSVNVWLCECVALVES